MAASVLQASRFRGDVTAFRLNARPRPKRASEPAFRRDATERVYRIEAAHNPEVAGSNPAPATAKGAGNGAFRVSKCRRRPGLLPKLCRQVRESALLSREQLPELPESKRRRVGSRGASARRSRRRSASPAFGSRSAPPRPAAPATPPRRAWGFTPARARASPARAYRPRRCSGSASERCVARPGFLAPPCRCASS